MKISIITATYNSEKFIQKCLDSLLIQKFQNFESIIIDGKSSDETLNLIKRHKFQPNIIISEPDEGIYNALNKGISLSSGEVIGFLHSDDFYSNENVLDKVSSLFMDNILLDVVYGDLQYINYKNNSVIRNWKSHPFKKKYLVNGWMPPHPTVFAKKKIYTKINSFDDNFKISGDYDSILKIFKDDSLVSYYLPEVLVKMRSGGISNRSLKLILLKLREDWIALKKNNYNYFDSLRAITLKNLLKLKQLF